MAKVEKSVLSAMLMHAMANVCAAAIPDYTMAHSLLINGVLTTILAAAVTLRARPRRRG